MKNLFSVPSLQSLLIGLFVFSNSIRADNALPGNYSYAVVISKAAYADAGWKAVADSLVKKYQLHGARLLSWTSSVSEVKADLTAFMPTYIGFIARPVTDCNTAFIAAASQLTRSLDSDPYGDAYWGVITGYNASDALRAISESLTVKTVILGSNDIAYEPPLIRFYQAIGMPCDSYTKTEYLFPNTQGKVYSGNQRPEAEQDRVKLVAKWLNAPSLNISVSGQGTITGAFDCLVTGGHGNVNVWQMHYSDAGTEGYLMSSAGQLYGQPYSGSRIDVNAPTPKIIWCASNCLMATPDNINNFVYAAFHTGHAVQMFGFIPEASTGDEFMAWGIYDRVTKLAGKYTLPQGFFIANNNAQFELRHPSGLFNAAGVSSYMDATVVYGDPAANVTFSGFADTAKAYKEDFTYTTDAQGLSTFTYTITAMSHPLEYSQGYCYQFRPVFFMPLRIDAASIAISKNDGHTADITDNLVIWELLANNEKLQKGASKTLRWTGKIIDRASVAALNSPGAQTGKRFEVSADRSGGNILLSFSNIPSGPMAISLINAAGVNLYSRHCVQNFSQRQQTVLPAPQVPGVYLVIIECEKTLLYKKIILDN